jgi:uncharacterized protein YqjF (DUF2071 family)
MGCRRCKVLPIRIRLAYPFTMSLPVSTRFLTADWRALLMVNYAVDPAIVRSLVPAGTELDDWQGTTLVSMVGFLFLDTRVLGVPFPFHRDFEEVNLRFYVRRKTPDGWRRGVVFVKEVVPRWIIAAIARGIYNERYVAAPMRHIVCLDPQHGGSATYEWKTGGHWHSLGAKATGAPMAMVPGSPEEFIFEHYWGYTRQRDGGTMEYEVCHEPWRVWDAQEVRFDCDVGSVYGAEWVEPLRAAPVSAFLAEGSAIEVRKGTRLAGPSGA